MKVESNAAALMFVISGESPRWERTRYVNLAKQVAGTA